MSKVDIKRLDSVTKNDTTATEQINDNFQALQQAIENTVSRDGTVPNYMDADLDLNSYKIINAGDPVNKHDVVTLKYFEEKAGGAIEAAAEAKASASQAASSAQSALVASNNAIGQLAKAESLLLSAEGQLAETQQYVDAAKADIDDTVEAGKQEINTTIDEAQMSLSDTINQAVEDVKTEAVAAAEGAIQDAAATATAIVVDYANNEIKPVLNEIASNAAESAENASESAGLAANESGNAAISATDSQHYAEDSRIWAEGEQAEVQELGGELSSKGWALQASNSATSASQSATQANTSETNAKGYADSIEPERFLNKEMITNCITEIPQDIKLELNNGTLTLKAGSKVYNGNGLLHLLTAESSSSQGVVTGDNIFAIFELTRKALLFFPQVQCGSGSSLPADGSRYVIFLNTSDGKIYRYNASGSDYSWMSDRGLSLPVALVSMNNGSVTSIDQVFNGFGYIGSTVFALPGVKGLIPDGRNADGTLKNKEFTVDKVLTNTAVRINHKNAQLILRKDYIQQASVRSAWKYYEAENLFVYTVNGDKNWMDLGTYETDSNGVMTLFQPKLPFRAVDQNDFNKLNEEVTTLDAQNAKLNGNNLFTGGNEFEGIFKLLYQDGNEGAQIDWKTGNQSVIRDTVVKQDVVDHRMRFYAGNSAGIVMFPLSLNFETGIATTTTPSASDNSQAAATTAWVRHHIRNVGGVNWAGKVSVAVETDYTAPSNGFIAYNCSTWNRTPKLTINGVEIFSRNGNVIAGFFGSVPVAKGDIIQISGDAGATIYFIPFK